MKKLSIKLETLNEHYGKLKKIYQPTKKDQSQILARIEKYGYLPLPYDIARKELSNADILSGLEILWRKRGVMKETSFIDHVHPLHNLGYNDSSWLVCEQHKIETLNLSGLARENQGKLTCCFSDWLLKILVTHPGNEEAKIAATTFYLLPPYKRDPIFGSAYCPLSSEIEPALVDDQLAESGIELESQVQLFIALAQLAGHPVLIDLLPQTGRFSKTVLTYPECFRWIYIFDYLEILRDEVVHLGHNQLEYYPSNLIDWCLEALLEDLHGYPLAIKPDGEYDYALKMATRTLYHQEYQYLLREAKKEKKKPDGISNQDLRQAILEQRKKWQAKEIIEQFYLPEDAFPILLEMVALFAEMDFSLQHVRYSFTQTLLLAENQEKIAAKVKELLEQSQCQTGETMSDQDHQKAVDILQKSGFWPIQGGSWNSVGPPVFHRLSPDEQTSFPIVDHYDYQGRLVNAFAGDMDIITPWYFVYWEYSESSDNLNDIVVQRYIEYCSDIYRRLRPNGFRIDHLDHSIDYPTSVNHLGNPISYRAPLKVFAILAQKISNYDNTFALMAEYMGWGDSLQSNLYKDYHNNGISLGISTDVVGEYRNNAPTIILEGNKVIADYNEQSGKKDTFSLTRVLDNHDRIHPDILPALSEFTEERALLKWLKCLFLPGGSLAPRPTLYLDGNETHTANKSFSDTFLAFKTLNRGSHYSFFIKFDALLRFSLNEPALSAGEAVVVFQRKPNSESNNSISAWLVLSQNNNARSFLVIASEWIDDKTSPPDQQAIELELPLSVSINAELILPEVEQPDWTKDYEILSVENDNLSNVKQSFTVAGNVFLTLPALSPNSFRIFCLGSVNEE